MNKKIYKYLLLAFNWLKIKKIYKYLLVFNSKMIRKIHKYLLLELDLPVTKKIYKYLLSAFKWLMNFYEIHPYRFSFIIAVIIISYSLFHASDLDIDQDMFIINENIIIVDIDEVQVHRRTAKKDYSLDEEIATTNIKNIERAVGVSDNIVDYDLLPDTSNLVTPRPVGRLKKIYPKIARDMNVEARLSLEILYDKDGKVRNVKVLGIMLSNPLPDKLHEEMEKKFIRDAKKILIGHQFTPPVYKGVKIPLKMATTFQFRLED